MKRDRVSGVVAALLLGIGALSLWSAHQSNVRIDHQRECLISYISNNAETSRVRSAAVTAESEATRSVISDSLTAKTRAEFYKARAAYFVALKRIDKLRAENPVKPFPKGVCD